MRQQQYKTDVLVVGAGLAGICTSLELLDKGYNVLMLDGSPRERFGGQAKEAFGGMLLNNTPEQQRNKVIDSSEQFWHDWQTAAQYKDEDVWAKRWGQAYTEHNRTEIYDWLHGYGIRFFPVVQWPERGNYGNGNAVPRYHVAWGCGEGVTNTLIEHLLRHPQSQKLTLLFSHKVTEVTYQNGRVVGATGTNDGGDFEVQAEHTVLCCGGINGNLEKVRQVWDPIYGPAPQRLLSGTHPSADGALHEAVEQLGGQVKNLHYMWNYAAGIAHPNPDYPHHGLSLIPTRSALWVDAHGRRVGPFPMVTGFDTHDLCKITGHLPHQYTWQIMNKRIADKELAISGSETNPHFRDKKMLKILLQVLRGNHQQTQWLIDECEDVVIGNTIEELAAKMQQLEPNVPIDVEGMKADIARYDHQARLPVKIQNDEQLRRIQFLRQWRGDRVRTCDSQPIVDAKHMPLIAMRLRLISRKSMGGMLTDLHSRVLDGSQNPIPGLYAAGEAAGFGGAGIAGIRSLEGTFIPNCIFNGRRAALGISEG